MYQIIALKPGGYDTFMIIKTVIFNNRLWAGNISLFEQPQFVLITYWKVKVMLTLLLFNLYSINS